MDIWNPDDWKKIKIHSLKQIKEEEDVLKELTSPPYDLPEIIKKLDGLKKEKKDIEDEMKEIEKKGKKESSMRHLNLMKRLSVVNGKIKIGEDIVTKYKKYLNRLN